MQSRRHIYEIPISQHPAPSRFFMAFGSILRVRSIRPLIPGEGVMLFDPKHEDRFDRLTEQLRLSPALKPDHLISNVIVHACTRIPAEKAARIDQLIEAGAWSDAALALVELELPAWKLRRLVYEDGQWLCSLSKQPNLPAALDDTADASHAVMPLAILTAFVEARRRASAMRETSLHTVPQVTRTSGYAVCCDNFS
jgi:hypothetical protein